MKVSALLALLLIGGNAIANSNALDGKPKSLLRMEQISGGLFDTHKQRLTDDLLGFLASAD